MSRIGKLPIIIPEQVTLEFKDYCLTAKGDKGELKQIIPSDVQVTQEEKKITFAPANDSIEAKANWGRVRSITNNMVVGVTRGFEKKLEINGTGYKASAPTADTLVLSLGYSHDIYYAVPNNIIIKCDKPTSISISGCSKQLVGQVAAEIRSLRPPEPYKGKGVKYVDEQLIRKEGKKK